MGVAVESSTIRRLVELDRVRGLAIVLMLTDHVAFLFGVDWVRLTLGRVAMPLFFLLAGVLVHRLSRRHGWALVLGLVLPLAAPWVDSPNVLVIWAAGCAVLVGFDRAGLPRWLLIVLALAVMANRWGVGSAGSYDPAALLGLMALGSVLGKGWALDLGGRLPPWMAVVGARPLLWYVGNVLAVQGVVVWLSRV